LLDAAKRLQAVKNDTTRSVEAKKNKMDEVHDNARGQIRQFLTPDQSKKLDAMKAEDIIKTTTSLITGGEAQAFPVFSIPLLPAAP
jgi:hypothetical protein